MGYVFTETEPGVFTVGYWTPGSVWNAEQDFSTREEAIAHMRYLNGAPDAKPPKPAKPPTSASAAKKP